MTDTPDLFAASVASSTNHPISNGQLNNSADRPVPIAASIGGGAATAAGVEGGESNSVAASAAASTGTGTGAAPATNNNNSTNQNRKKSKGGNIDDDEKDPLFTQYILGTLIVRVVAARDLEPVDKGGIGRMLFGGSSRNVRSSSRGYGGGSGGGTNPYASVKFGGITQRTSEVFDSLEPVWPRGETMYMDVSLPVSYVTHLPADVANIVNNRSGPSNGNNNNIQDNATMIDIPKPVLTVAVFHTDEIGRVHKQVSPMKKKSPLKRSASEDTGDSDDYFLGMAAVDLTQLITGKKNIFDQWLPLSGTEDNCGSSIRIVCEYEASDPPPRVGDYVKFTRYCHPADLYPLPPSGEFQVVDIDGDNIVLTYLTALESWECTFIAHRFMVICVNRHHGAIELAQDELVSLTERLSHSPLVNAVGDTVNRVADDGLIHVTAHSIQSGINLLTRWLENGPDTVIGDVAHATNWDGRFNPDLSLGQEDTSTHPIYEPTPVMGNTEAALKAAAAGVSQQAKQQSDSEQPLPNMPVCPITGEQMHDPVVAADGHTYERSAIARWLLSSDKSPLTGSVLPHKELVPNYSLLSSLQEAAKKQQELEQVRTEQDKENLKL